MCVCFWKIPLYILSHLQHDKDTAAILPIVPLKLKQSHIVLHHIFVITSKPELSNISQIIN